MTFFKIIFVILLCLPIVYLAMWFITQLIDQIIGKNRKRGRMDK